MRSKLICWCAFITLFLLCPPATALAADQSVGVAYRGHIQDLGDYPSDSSWVNSPQIIGTTGQSKRIEGFEIKLTGEIPAGMEMRYNVHVQNKGWLYDENDVTNWPKDGDYAGTRGESLRIEAVKIVLTDSDGKAVSGYSVQYRGHVQNVGDQPADESQWIADGDQLGTVGSSLRLEALLVKVVKNQTDLTAYQALLKAIGKTVETDYTAATWGTLQKALTDNAVTANNNQTEVDKATTAIQKAYDGLEKKAATVVYDKAGTYGPATGTEVINGDVIVKADGIKLRNLHINGDLYIGTEQVTEKAEEISADTINDDQITTKTTGGVMLTGLDDTYIANLIRPSEGTAVSIAGSPSQTFTFCLSGGTQFAATTPSGGLEVGSPMQIAASASLGSGYPAEFGIGGAIGSLILQTPGTQVSLAPGSQVQQLSVQTGASNCGVISSSTALIQNLVVQGPGATFTCSGTIQNVVVQGMGATFAGSGMIQHADIQADGASFATRPGDFTVAPGVATPPSMPAPPNSGGGGYAIQSPPGFSSTGAVAFPTTVAIFSQGADAIYYTTDGSDPITTGVPNTTKVVGGVAGIVVESNMTLKAIATRSGYVTSAIASATFTQATSADLAGIAISPAAGNFNFSATTYNYPNVTVANDVEGIFVTPLGNGSSVITVNDTVVASGAQIAQPIAVSYNSETAITIVNREPGKLPKTYTIKVTPSSGIVTPIVSKLKASFAATATALDLNTSGIFSIKPGINGVLSNVTFTSNNQSVIKSGTSADGTIPILKDGPVTLTFTTASMTLLQGGTTYNGISLNNAEIVITSTAYLTKVNSGTGTLADYAAAGINGVVDGNLAGINQAVAAAAGTELNQDAIQTVVNGYLAGANNFVLALENSNSKIQNEAFNLNITSAKDSDGNLLNGDQTITVTSTQSDCLTYSQTATFINGTAKIPISISKIGAHTLTVAVNGVTQNLAVTVSLVAVTGVSVNPTTVTLNKGATAQLSATVLPDNANNKAVSWESDTPGVASVVNGTVTAISEGTATITVTTVDGSYPASCVVTVKDLKPTITGVSLPSYGGTPTATITETNQYTGTIVWKEKGGADLATGALFGGAKTYVATINLSPKAPYTSEDIGTNFFAVNGASCTNSAKSPVITAEFPATGPFQIDGSGLITSYVGPGGIVTIPDTVNDIVVTGIGENVFNQAVYNNTLTEISIPATATIIKKGAFHNCRNLSTVTFRETSQLKTLEKDAFSQCALTSIVLPAKLVTIGDYAFYHNKLSGTLTIPATVTSIGEYAFEGDTPNTLTTLVIGDGTALNIDLDAFKYNQLKTITLPDNVTIHASVDTMGAFGSGLRAAYMASGGSGGAGTYNYTSTWTKKP